MKKHLLFLGAPGAGKGTQAQLLSETNSYLHLSTGELLRKEIEMNSNLGIQVKDIMNRGELVSDELVLKIVCLLYTSPSPRDLSTSRMPSSA